MNPYLNRRELIGVAAMAAALCVTPTLMAHDAEIKTKTYTYKQVGDLEIKADVYRANDQVPRPVVVWIHGGALINGHRAGVSGRVRNRMLESGYIVVSIDYRLAPETKLPAIIEDVEDAFSWIREQGPSLFHADTSRIAVTGGSAGGCLTLTAGFRVAPRPTVLVAFWGYGDLIGDWYSKPSPHARHNRVPISSDHAYAQVSGPPVSDSRDRRGNGGIFYNFCRQKGIWPREVTGWDPVTDRDKFIPYMAVRNVTPDYPPTLLIHGTHDTDVPYEQSTMMAAEFSRHGVDHQLISIPNGEHGLGGGDPKLIDDAYESAFEFIDRYMRN